MEFYEKSTVRLNAIRKIDSDYVEPETNNDEPKADKYGFTGGVTQTVQESSLPVEVLRERELKWIKMIKNWEKWNSTKKFPKLKERCRKGIPPAMRGSAWQHLCGAMQMKKDNTGLFGRLISQRSEWECTIEKDLDRTFPFHDMFSKPGSGQQELLSVLKAYSLYDPEVGYCQAMAPVSAVLLMHMSTEHVTNSEDHHLVNSRFELLKTRHRILDAFWCLVQLLKQYVKGYYGEKLEAIRLEGEIFRGLLSKVLPSLAKHMESHHIDPLMYMTEWFMCLFSRNLPFASVLRIWDMFFCEGVKVLFRTALTILKLTLTPAVLKTCQGMFETNDRLRNLPLDLMQEDTLIPAILDLELSIKQIEKEHKTQAENQTKTIVVR